MKKLDYLFLTLEQNIAKYVKFTIVIFTLIESYLNLGNFKNGTKKSKVK